MFMPIQRKKGDCDLGGGYKRVSYILASHMPELLVCIIYANF